MTQTELDEILKKHELWLKNEPCGERAYLFNADLSGANLSNADLRGANLSDANLRDANLRDADLRNANLSNTGVLTFQFQRDQAIYTPCGNLRIGCLYHPIEHWAAKVVEFGRRHYYTDLEIKAYGQFIKICLEVKNGT